MLMLKVKKKIGEKVRSVLSEKGIIDKNYKIDASEEHLFFPITQKVKDIEKLGTIVKKQGKKRILNVRVLPSSESISKSHDLIGDIVVLESDDFKTAKKLAPDFLNFYSNSKTVVMKSSKTEGEFRVRQVKFLAGEKKTLTLHKENGCRFYVDLNKVFFTPRLSTERSRIMNQVKDNETIIDFFSGVGPYIIPIAKFKDIKAFAVDKNPDAFELLKKNAELNDVNVKCFNNDARTINLKVRADRIIMNLPKTSEDFLNNAFSHSKKGTIIHFYHFSPEEDLFNSHKKMIEEKAKKHNFKVKFLKTLKAGEVGIRQYRIVIDFKLY